MDNNYILQMKNIRITFGALVANDNVNLNVKKGTVHALIGENGAGKSTLMNVLTGILRPDCGEIILNGEEVTFKNSLDVSRRSVRSTTSTSPSMQKSRICRSPCSSRSKL